MKKNAKCWTVKDGKPTRNGERGKCLLQGVLVLSWGCGGGILFKIHGFSGPQEWQRLSEFTIFLEAVTVGLRIRDTRKGKAKMASTKLKVLEEEKKD